jgi:hypothetical protein
MTDQELKDLLVKLEPAGLGPLPKNIALTTATGKTIPLSDAFDEVEEAALPYKDVDEDDIAYLFSGIENIEQEEKKEDPIQAAIKKDPLFGTW